VFWIDKVKNENTKEVFTSEAGGLEILSVAVIKMSKCFSRVAMRAVEGVCLYWCIVWDPLDTFSMIFAQLVAGQQFSLHWPCGRVIWAASIS
jgi:hypothetical protein